MRCVVIFLAVLITMVACSGPDSPPPLDCTDVACAAVVCENPVRPKGQCCDRCVPRPGAKCAYGGNVYKSGDTFKSLDGCNDCECSDGPVYTESV